MRLAFIDCETTGLDPARHDMWELAAIIDDGDGKPTEHTWGFVPDLPNADAQALRVGGFYKRTSARDWKWNTPDISALTIARYLDGAQLVGVCPWFDAAFVGAFLTRHGGKGTWHHHMVDVLSLAAGRLRMPPPWDTTAIGEALGVARLHAHTALGDARYARAVYRAVMEGTDA